jgi:hypothetical protein
MGDLWFRGIDGFDSRFYGIEKTLNINIYFASLMWRQLRNGGYARGYNMTSLSTTEPSIPDIDPQLEYDGAISVPHDGDVLSNEIDPRLLHLSSGPSPVIIRGDEVYLPDPELTDVIRIGRKSFTHVRCINGACSPDTPRPGVDELLARVIEEETEA